MRPVAMRQIGAGGLGTRDLLRCNMRRRDMRGRGYMLLLYMLLHGRGYVLLLHGRGNARGPFRIVGYQEQAFAGFVEPSNVRNPGKLSF